MRTSGDRDDPGGYRRLAAIEGWVYTRPYKTKNNDVLFRVPFYRYFCNKYNEISMT